MANCDQSDSFGNATDTWIMWEGNDRLVSVVIIEESMLSVFTMFARPLPTLDY